MSCCCDSCCPDEDCCYPQDTTAIQKWKCEFSNLRRQWSDYTLCCQKNDCDCCCPPKCLAKGKFGLAWIAETPNKKCCLPCGWQLEICDTPSRIESQCDKMLSWANCPMCNNCDDCQYCCPKPPCCSPKPPCCKKKCCKPSCCVKVMPCEPPCPPVCCPKPTCCFKPPPCCPKPCCPKEPMCCYKEPSCCTKKQCCPPKPCCPKPCCPKPCCPKPCCPKPCCPKPNCKDDDNCCCN